ncbi:MAG: glycosyltransferase family 2 protein, partial [Candidatus Daviesbacteria bacterium]|nr:glycosyltransferase family 2 protein [Candidatus Daviesbacteria bacterium]
MTSVDIIIVNYNAGDHILKCLESVSNLQGEAEIKIWVVDNNSLDQSPEKIAQSFPKVNLIKNSQNLGFGKANNLALKKSTAEFILILNPDTILEPGTISFLTKYLDEFKDIGAATGQVVFKNGETDLTAHRGFPTP